MECFVLVSVFQGPFHVDKIPPILYHIPNWNISKKKSAKAYFSREGSRWVSQIQMVGVPEALLLMEWKKIKAWRWCSHKTFDRGISSNRKPLQSSLMPEFGQGDRAPQEHACYWAQPQAQEGCAVLSLELHGCWEPGGDLISRSSGSFS